MIIAWIFLLVSLSIVACAAMLWFSINELKLKDKLTWKVIARKVTQPFGSQLSLCHRCGNHLEVLKCFLIAGRMYCPFCTAVVGTNLVTRAVETTVVICKIVIVFFGVIALMAAFTVFGVI